MSYAFNAGRFGKHIIYQIAYYKHIYSITVIAKHWSSAPTHSTLSSCIYISLNVCLSWKIIIVFSLSQRCACLWVFDSFIEYICWRNCSLEIDLRYLFYVINKSILSICETGRLSWYCSYRFNFKIVPAAHTIANMRSPLHHRRVGISCSNL